MLQKCALPRNDFYMRVHPPETTALTSQIFDDQIMKAVTQLYKISDSPQIREAAQLPELWKLRLDPPVSDMYETSLHSSGARLPQAQLSIPVEPRTRLFERYERIRRELQQDPIWRTTLRDCGQKESSFFVNNLKSTLRGDFYAAAMRYRLNSPHALAASVQLCCGNKAMSPIEAMHHFCGCPKGRNYENANTRSNAARDFLVHTINNIGSIGVKSTSEPRNYTFYVCNKCDRTIQAADLSTHKRSCNSYIQRKGVDFTLETPGTTKYYDITFCTTTCVSHRGNHHTSVFSQRIRDKAETYHRMFKSDEDFIVLPLTPLGRLHENTKALLRHIAAMEGAGYWDLVGRFADVHQRYTGACICDRKFKNR